MTEQERVTIKGQDYIVRMHHDWAGLPNTSRELRKTGCTDVLYMQKPRGQVIFSVHVFANNKFGSIYGKVSRVCR